MRTSDKEPEPRRPLTGDQIRHAAAPKAVPYTPKTEEKATPWWQRLLKGAAWLTWFIGPAAPPPSTLEDMHNARKNKKRA